MSSATNTPESLVPTVASTVTGLGAHAASSVRTAAFWVAVVLPFVVLLALSTGYAAEYPVGVVAVVALNAVAAVVGHNHTP